MSDGPNVTVTRAAELLLCGRTQVFKLLKEFRLDRGPRFGKETTVTLESVEALQHAAQTAPAPAPKRRRSRRAERVAEVRALDW